MASRGGVESGQDIGEIALRLDVVGKVLAGMKTRGNTVKEFGAAGVRSGRAIGWVVKGSVAVGGFFLA